MASYSLCENSLTKEKETVKLYAFITIGAAGAVSSFKGGGILSVVKEATAGQYTVTLDQKWQRLLGVSHKVIDNAVSPIAQCQLLNDFATLQTAIKTGTPALLIQLLDYAGLAADATATTVLQLEISLRRSSVETWD
jgi:hypothetical protein